VGERTTTIVHKSTRITYDYSLKKSLGAMALQAQQCLLLLIFFSKESNICDQGQPYTYYF